MKVRSQVGPALIAEPVGWVRRSVGLKDLT